MNKYVNKKQSNRSMVGRNNPMYGIHLRGRDNGNYKDGRTLKKFYCKEKDCNNEISMTSGIYGQGRCKECYFKCKYLKRNIYYCKNCGKEVSKKSYNLCQKCENKMRINREILEGKSHGFYGKKHKRKAKKKMSISKGGTGTPYENTEYGTEFTQDLKEQIRKRDNYTCQKCQITEEEHITVYGRVLSIHHIDYNKKNCNQNNLITLCNECNIRVNYNREYWVQYFIEKIMEFQIESR